MTLPILSARGVDCIVSTLNTDSAVVQDVRACVQQGYLLSARDVTGLLISCNKPTMTKNTGYF